MSKTRKQISIPLHTRADGFGDDGAPHLHLDLKDGEIWLNPDAAPDTGLCIGSGEFPLLDAMSVLEAALDTLRGLGWIVAHRERPAPPADA